MAFRTRGRFPLAALLSLSLFLSARAADPEKRENTALKPVVKNEERHKVFLDIAKKGHIDVVFIGDSITDAWGGAGHGARSSGADVWKERFEPLHAANFGIGGDRTQHLLWRIDNGELDGYQARAVVLMIGTNNLRDNTDEEIAEGIKAVVAAIRKKQPHAKVLLLGVFPRGEQPADKNRERIMNINKAIAKLDDDGKTVKYLDFGNRFLELNGTISKEIMPDFLHLTKKGYEIWGDAIDKPLKDLLK
jgi:lysophospholipase L1-like esterase